MEGDNFPLCISKLASKKFPKYFSGWYNVLIIMVIVKIDWQIAFVLGCDNSNGILVYV